MKATNLIAAGVVGGSLILAAAVFAVVTGLLREAGEAGRAEVVARLEREVDARENELRALRGELRAREAEFAALRDRRAATGSPTPVEPAEGVPMLDQFGGLARSPEQDEGLIDLMELAPDRFNQGVERPRPTMLRALLGDPRQTYSQDCQPVTNPRLVAALETRQVASFRLTMLRPALESLEAVVDRLRREEPAIYAALGTAGGLCARYVRGSNGAVSSHAWGAAVDLTLRGDLDRMGDASTQFGLVVLAEYFNDVGWFWGAAYGREDSMHFEVGEALLRQWVAEGKL